MKYFGGKSRIAKTLGNFLNSRIKETDSKLYLEPFCGGCWVREMSQDNEVYVSEYVAPNDFEAVISIPTKLEVRTKNEGRADRVEKLFSLKKS